MPSLDLVVIKAGIITAIVNFWWQFVGAIALLILLSYGLCRFCIYMKRPQPHVIQPVEMDIHQKACHVQRSGTKGFPAKCLSWFLF
ncbi:uncharacterized protein PFLUO_LOCUS6013 [Penicillium psychrofluorescens]|uniref:uncharacterized protein n=1 Tax=Penicillium psychrofluorescens TaxID=3158075 RepID=UPI003CCCEFB1